MSQAHAFAALLAVTVGAVVYWIAYLTGRMHGYQQGVERGTQLNSKAQHIKGMTDGYVMAIQHTPEQRVEYMNNVLLKIGAVTPADIEADRLRRLQLQGEL